ncbi:hypothetical protein KP509_36G036000 [Ceratopteris richardii]|nr:hypothetical protein KP509_36G036000 [Ceratopteris richardii]
MPSQSHSTVQDESLQGNATLVPPLASYPPMGANFLCASYMMNYTVPAHCVPSEMILTKDIQHDPPPEYKLDGEDDIKPDKEHKKRSKNWTRLETLKLIRLRTKMASKFNRTGRKTDLWEQIASALHMDHINRDAQQCRDKWEKLMAGYKEVKDGIKERDEYPFYEELYALLSGKTLQKDIDTETNDAGTSHVQHRSTNIKEAEKAYASFDYDCDGNEDDKLEQRPSHKRKKSVALTDLQTIQAMLETVIAQQQTIFKDFLDTLERKEQLREQIRQEQEDKWRAEELAQSRILSDTMIVLIQTLVAERLGTLKASTLSTPVTCNQQPSSQSQMACMKRSKNWKRSEVLQLIRQRGEMKDSFTNCTRRAALWTELSEKLGNQGVNRDGKQCRDKWDKLMAEYKDVIDGKQKEGNSPYFHELSAIMEGGSTDTG